MLVMDVVHPVRHAQRRRPAGDQAAVVVVRPVQRMVLEDQQLIGRRMHRERSHHLFDEVRHGAKTRVVDDLAVVVDLQRHQHVALVLRWVAEEAQHVAFQPAVFPLAHATPNPAQALADRMQAAVVLVMRVTRTAFPQLGGIGHRNVGHFAKLLMRGLRRRLRLDVEPAVEGRVARDGRFCVDAADLQRHVVRPKVAFLEHIDGDAQRTRFGQRRVMHRAGLAKQHQRVDLMRDQAFTQPGRPFRRWLIEGPGAILFGKIELVTRVEIDLPDRLPMVAQRLRQGGKEPAHGALQQQRATLRQQAV
ncbi:hypothetical protein GCM10009107_61460 [Ideonella azotifigens]|uniref:Uncharacterized protein n=1 Tax=Ideonella azotifigens TaxID=513160 RepID=A0ABN1KL49_9BURK